MKTIYGLMTNTDRTEGRGTLTVVCCATTREIAEKVIVSQEFGKRFGIMGFPGRVEDIKEVHVLESVADLKDLPRT